jgi:ankyrin repeat protein
LIKKGANINAKNRRRETALIYAVRNDSKESVKILLEKGANPNIKTDYGKTAMDMSSEPEIEKLISNAIK